MGGAGGMDDQRLHIGHVGQQGEDGQVVDELLSGRSVALHLKGEDAAAAVGQVLLIQRVAGLGGQRGMVHGLHLGMLGQVVHQLERVGGVPLHPQGQRLQPLEEQEGVEGREGRAGVAQQYGADVGHEGGGPHGVGKGHPVVAGVRVGDPGVLAACLPVEPAALHDHPADGCAVAADELGGRVDHDVRAVLERPHQIGGGEGVVHHQRDAGPVGDLGHGLDVHQVGIGIAQGLHEDGLGVGLDRGLQRGGLWLGEGGGDAVGQRQGVGQQVVGAAVDGLGRHDVLPRPGQRLEGIADGRRARRHRQRRRAVLQRRDARLEHAVGGVGQASVDVARVPQTEAVRGVLGVVEYEGGRGVDRHRAGVGHGVGLLLADVQLLGFKSPVGGIANIRHGERSPFGN